MVSFNNIRTAYAFGCKHRLDCCRSCSEWDLEESELPSEKAETEAALAFRAAKAGSLREALNHAQEACRLEAEDAPDSPSWKELSKAIRQSIKQQTKPKMTEQGPRRRPLCLTV